MSSLSEAPVTPPRTTRTQVARRTDDLTPKRILKANLLEYLKSAKGNVKQNVPIVLYTCGSLCPVHLQHVALQEMAKDHLQCSPYNLTVVGGYLATSNDLYVKQKYVASNRLGSFLDWQTRAFLIKLAIKDHPFIAFDGWDGEYQPFFQEYFAAQKHLQSHLDLWCSEEGLPRVKVVAVHGSDHVNKCGLAEWFPRQGLGCVCVERPPGRAPKSNPDRFFFSMSLPRNAMNHHAFVSSTRVQQLLKGAARKKGELYVEKMLHPAVLKELKRLWKVEEQLPKQKNDLEIREVHLDEIKVYKILSGCSTLVAYDSLLRRRRMERDQQRSLEEQEWAGIYTQLERPHVLGTLPYRWDRGAMEATLVEVTLRNIDVLVLDGDLMHRNDLKGGEKACAVKLKLGIDRVTPLVEAIGRKGQLIAVKETQDEWEMVLPHSILKSLEVKERVLGKFCRHETKPVVSKWAPHGKDWQDYFGCDEPESLVSLVPTKAAIAW